MTFLYAALLILWWHLTPWLIRLALLKALPPIIGQIVQEVKSNLGRKPEDQ